MNIKKGLVGLVLGMSTMLMPLKADMPNKTVTRYVAHIQNYIEDKGYKVSVEGTDGKKDYTIAIDDTLRNENCELEPKISLYPTSEGVPMKRWILFYDKENKEDFDFIEGVSKLNYEMLGVESDIVKTLDKYFDKSVGCETGVKERDLSLNVNPNPFNSEVQVNYKLDRETDVKVNVYDIKGNLVRRLTRGRKEKGKHSLRWNATVNGTGLASGKYFVEMVADGKRFVRGINYLR